jgi:hypothetical protein
LAFLQGVLRFPQRFWMVFCGEFVVVWWWDVVLTRRVFGVRKFSLLLKFIFWVDGRRARAATIAIVAARATATADPCGMKTKRQRRTQRYAKEQRTQRYAKATANGEATQKMLGQGVGGWSL